MKTMIMEHNVEELIRKKINLAEQSPIEWKSEWVWSRIETPVRTKNYIFWYAAASSVICILCISLYLISLKYEKEMTSQLNSLELQMNKLSALITQNEFPEEKCNDEVSIGSGSPIVSDYVSDKKVSPSKRSAATLIADHSDFILNDSEILVVDKNDPVTTHVDEASNSEVNERERIIKPIIGKIPQSKQTFVSARDKDIKVSIFKSDNINKNLVTDSRNYKILSARIKN